MSDDGSPRDLLRGGSLTDRQVEFFRRSGYLKLPVTIPSNLAQAALDQIGRAIAAQEAPFRTDASGRIHRLNALYQRGGAVKDVFTSGELLDALESLLGPNIEFVLNRHNHATLNSRGAVAMRLHRDILQWSRSIVTAIVYLEDALMENGCTWLVPTSQYLPFVGIPNNGGTWMDEHAVYSSIVDQALACPINRGGILLFDSLAFHTVGLNSTEGTRVSMTAGYHSVDELDGAVEHAKRVLVRGQRIYRGSDGERR